MDEVLIDTDILNEILKRKNVGVVQRAAEYLIRHGRFTISSITRYELLRGLKEKNAAAQLIRFHAFCRNTSILPVIDEVLDTAADLWVAGRKQGLTPKDADLIIAATALHHRRVLVTGNTSDFSWVPGLRHENWREA